MPSTNVPIEKPGNTRSPETSITLASGESARLADLSDRVMARLIDTAVMVVSLFVIGALLFAATFEIWDDGSDDSGAVIVALTFSVAAVIFEPFCVWISGGKSLGKKAAGIRVVRIEGTRIGDGLGVLIRSAIPMSALLAGFGVMAINVEVLSGWPLLGGFGVWLLIYFSSVWGKYNRGWHDKAAGTVVVASDSK